MRGSSILSLIVACAAVSACGDRVHLQIKVRTADAGEASSRTSTVVPSRAPGGDPDPGAGGAASAGQRPVR